MLLIDLISTLFDTLKENMAKNNTFINLYLHNIINVFFEIENNITINNFNDTKIFPVLECLTSVLSVLGLQAQEYILLIYEKCLKIAYNCLVLNNNNNNNNNENNHIENNNNIFVNNNNNNKIENSNNKNNNNKTITNLNFQKEITINCIDVFSALCESLKTNFLLLVNNTETFLFQIIFHSFCDDVDEIKQSGFSLIGFLVFFFYYFF
jgi:hypothetical protein